MKKYFVIIVVLFCSQINAQTLTGLVYDRATKQPVADVYVYLDGTSMFNITGNSGRFTLSAKQMINTKLVLSHLAYQTLIIENPFMLLPDTIYLETRLNKLNEITIQADPFSRRQKLAAFRQQFLGTTQAGKSCDILNEDDIQVWFNSATKTLFASSERPIEVINEYLGYRILFTLVDFKAEYAGSTLNANRINLIYYAGTTSFTDLEPDDIKIKQRRYNVYEVSSRNFFKSLAYDPLFGSDSLSTPTFRIYKDGSLIDICSHFTIKDTLSLKTLHIYDTVSEKINPDNPLLRITVSNRDNENPAALYYSRINFFTNMLLVDRYGNIDQIDKVIFSGQMGLSRVGDMLPVEYEP
ncbi:MAG: carboxypeptidase-like regulatory domain-containing protein [Bacteroidales bacterium]|jgi:hypothetical protein|nr:carboxypeptidase-like regulatory domain-containing protein [Bacteroidales bacterium]